MHFLRTKSGISNLHLFYDVDLIFYTEGGKKSFSTEEVENGKYNDISFDIKFWRYVLDANEFTKKVQFRAIGSKTASLSICKKIINNEIHNVVVAKDRDLDDYLDATLMSTFILYTKGYSWENDVFIHELTFEQIKSMLLMDNVPDEIEIIVNEAYGEFGRIGKHLAKLEILFRKNGIRFISDFNGERFFNSKNGVHINKEQVFVVLNEKMQELDRPINNGVENSVCPFLNNYGKLIQTLSVTIITYVCKKYGGIGTVAFSSDG